MKKHNDEKELRLVRVEPDVDIYETKDTFVLTADIPGVTDKGLDVTLEGNSLTINGKTAEDTALAEGQEYSRSFTLTDRVDKKGIKAAVKDGVLTMTFPFAEEAKASKVPITYN